ncbi:MAG: site-specific DNA-methyltransferase [Candidatus Dojkabacteria bacterium]|nr:site-specific DNA-methyltransferase [Candidatus Dojkabacteria bacterium]
MFKINDVIVGDCLNVMRNFPDECIDLVITSPPYNKKGKHGGKLVEKVIYDNYGDDMSEEDYQKWQIEVLNEIYRILKPNGALFYNHKVRYDDGNMIHPVIFLVKSKFIIWQEIIWNRAITGNIRGWRFWNIDERIYWLVKQKPKELIQNYAQMTSIWNIRVETEHKIHPAVFPVDIPKRIIGAILGEEKGIVLDPFCGTGTTLVAAKEMGKDYIGIDISDKYVGYAKKRLQEVDPILFWYY